MKERFRDKTRDQFAEKLTAIGVRAILSNRERPEEKIGNRMMRRSLGIIDIDDGGPITFVNIIKQDGTDKSPPRWWFYLGVPSDKQLPKSRSVNIRT